MVVTTLGENGMERKGFPPAITRVSRIIFTSSPVFRAIFSLGVDFFPSERIPIEHHS